MASRPTMLEEIEDQPEVLRRLAARRDELADQLGGDPGVFRRVLLTGCGDMHFAARLVADDLGLTDAVSVREEPAEKSEPAEPKRRRGLFGFFRQQNQGSV